jgi:hypothetical protein
MIFLTVFVVIDDNKNECLRNFAAKVRQKYFIGTPKRGAYRLLHSCCGQVGLFAVLFGSVRKKVLLAQILDDVDI